MECLISSETLAASESAVVFDCRFSLFDADAGRRDYAAAHIPKARYADLERDLSSAPGAGGRHPLPDRDRLAARLRTFGVDQDSTVVCYDQSSGALACRLWWLLRWLGHADVRVLDGGLDAWIAAGMPTDAEPVAVATGNFSARPPLTRSCAAEACLGTDAVLLDAREPQRYRGESEPIDPVAGHIPGAVCAAFGGNLAHGRFRTPAELRRRFEELGVREDRDAICYCGSGVTATHNILALLTAGYPEPVLYPGSWSEWIADPERPIATG